MDIKTAKKELRTQTKARTLALSDAEKKQASRRIFEAVSLLSAYRKATSVMLYAATPNEVDTTPLLEDVLKRGLTLWLPWCREEDLTLLPVKVRDLRNDLVVGAYGIHSPQEPINKVMPEDFQPSIIFVPGVVFDKKGNRIGRGLGYYDKFLAELPSGTLKIGLAFGCQVVGSVPTEDFDQRLDQVISG